MIESEYNVSVICNNQSKYDNLKVKLNWGIKFEVQEKEDRLINFSILLDFA